MHSAADWDRKPHSEIKSNGDIYSRKRIDRIDVRDVHIYDKVITNTYTKSDSVWIRILSPPFVTSPNPSTRSPFSLISIRVEMTYQNGKSSLKRILSYAFIVSP